MTSGVTTPSWDRGSKPSRLGQTIRTLKEMHRWILPNPGWVTFILSLITVTCVVWSVESAHWVATPPLAAIVFVGLLTGLMLAKMRLHALLLQLGALLVGVGTIAWFGIQLIEDGSWSYRLGEMWARLELWFNAAANNGISTDPMPFGLVLVILSWLLAYLFGWAIFRYSNVWIPLLFTGFAIMMNLSYLSVGILGFFFTYILFGMLLTAWMAIQRRRHSWSEARIALSPFLGASNLNAAFWFSLTIIIFSLLLPLRHGTVPVLQTGYEYLRLPTEQLRSDFNRLFAGLPARKPLGYRTFDDTLPFQGRIQLTDEEVFSVRSSLPGYLRARSYPVYTSQGWLSGESQVVPMDWESHLSLPTNYLARQPVTQQVTLNFSTKILMIAGSPDDADLRLKVEVPTTPTYTISLGELHSTQALPQDVTELAQTLATHSRTQQDELSESEILRLLPSDLRLTKVTTLDNLALSTVTVERPIPLPLAILSVRSAKRLSRHDSYTVSSSVSLASVQELREAGEGYPAWIRDIYLDFPDSLPTRVRTLAQELTAQAETAYDKAVAIQNYLHTLKYTLDVPPLPLGGDGAEHLLFTVGGGYSEYFGSTMAVMLRTVGIPSRMVVGYTRGDLQKDGSFIVRDRNSHGWAEVFFPDYGWVEFEPTPGREPIPRGEEAASNLEFVAGFGGAFDDDEEEFPLDMSGLSARGDRSSNGLARWLIFGTFGAIAFVALGTTVYLGLMWLLGPPATLAGAYAKMTRLSSLAGLGIRQGQSPREYGRSLGFQLGGYDTEVEIIAAGYAEVCYGRQLPPKVETERVVAAWRTIRLPLFASMLRRRRKP